MFLGIVEEGLLLEEDTVQTPAVEEPALEELPAELPPPELQEVTLLPEPPVESDTSGSGTGDLNDALWPPTSEAAAEEKTSLEDASEDVGGDAGDVAADGEETTAEDMAEDLEEVVPHEEDVPELIEISTIASETTEEELPALVPVPDTLDVASEASQPEAAETPPASEDTSEGAAEDSNPAGVPPANEAEDVNANALPEAPAEVEETSEAPKITTEDLTEDEIILVNKDGPELPVTDSMSPVQPTALSPERESPFTRISDVKPASEGPPDVDLPSLEVEVKKRMKQQYTAFGLKLQFFVNLLLP